MQRAHLLQDIHQAYNWSRVCAILGPRQCGKTTLAKQYYHAYEAEKHYFDLENLEDIARLADPYLALKDLQGLIVIDEVQRVPELFQTLRVLVDNTQQRYLILGSASRELIRQSSESLAGRIHYMELTPFYYGEVEDIDKLWLRGGFPLAYLADNDIISNNWRQNYIKTFLENDVPNLGIQVPAEMLRRFWMMITHYHGQLFNASELANSLDISHPVAQRYLDILTGTFMVRQLNPWYENLSKRQIKSKKIYFKDSGIYHTLLNVSDKNALLTHPKLGASWEGFALESVIRYLTRQMHIDQYDCYFWGTHGGAELDLFIVKGMTRLGFEFKYTLSPTVTKSMQIAISDLKLDKLTVIYPGEHRFPLTDQITCVGLQSFLSV